MLKKGQNNFVWVTEPYKERFLELLLSLDVPMHSSGKLSDYTDVGPTGVYLMYDSTWLTETTWRDYNAYLGAHQKAYPEIKIEDLLGPLYDESLINQEEVAAFKKELLVKYK